MLDIFFESDKEVMSFCEKLFQKNKQIAVQWKVNEKWGNQISLQREPLNEFVYQSIAQSMVYVFINYRLGNMIKEIIQKNYYYSDRHEIEQIHELAEWIVTGEDLDCVTIRANKHPVQLLRAIFLMHIRNAETIHFDSIVQFGMKVFKGDLIDYVGLAIDEFKREEEHQSFIHTLREYIVKKGTNIPVIHVVEANPFAYYNDAGRQFTKIELQRIMKKAPLYLVGLPPNEWNLSPLVAMVPEEINLYVDDSSNSKTQTILNVFQERVTLYSIHDFPFHFSVKR